MKYLITESQFDKVIFKYLDNQDFIQINSGDNIFFVNSEGDEYAQIRFDKDGWCFINFDLVEEISSFFSLQRFDSKQVISRWVENTLQMKVTDTGEMQYHRWWRRVENTLQMKVTDTFTKAKHLISKLRIPSK